MFSAWISPDLHLVKWTRHIVDFSYFVAALKVHFSGSSLQLASQLVSLTTSVIKMMESIGNFLIRAKLINHWPGITCEDEAERHYK